ncbi:MAG: hypothetical protein NZ741_12890, partial [Armatimonadetes bacterium]|nr:hypothetical protein [Armatimonadota bacterium]
MTIQRASAVAHVSAPPVILEGMLFIQGKHSRASLRAEEVVVRTFGLLVAHVRVPPYHLKSTLFVKEKHSR